MVKVFFLLLFMAISPQAFAGGWTSSGTELQGDSRNPWFLPNTKHVTYCILLDEQNFGSTRAQASDLIAQSFKFWEKEFEWVTGYPDGPLPYDSWSYTSDEGARVVHRAPFRTPIWQETTCSDANDESVDLRFQLGVLTQEQENFIKSPGQFAAITIRTDYDQVRLRGKGFIYVSPVSGRLAYNHETWWDSKLWTREEGKNFYHVLRHELGHVYGLPHSGSPGQLMSEDFAESFEKMPSDAFDNYFSFAREKKYCRSLAVQLYYKPDLVREVFNITDPNRSCLRFEFIHKPKDQFGRGAGAEMKVYLLSWGDEVGTLIGMATLDSVVYTESNVLFIRLNPKQKLYDENRWTTPGIRMGLRFMKARMKGIYRSLDGKIERRISISFEQGNPTVSGSYVLNGELWEDAF